MAEFNATGLDSLIEDLGKLADIPDDIAFAMVTAQAEVIAEAERRNARSMLSGPYGDGSGVANSIAVDSPKRQEDGNAIVTIAFKGKQHGAPNATVAYINEYGKKKQPARPFIKTSIAQTEQTSLQAALKIWDEYIKR